MKAIYPVFSSAAKLSFRRPVSSLFPLRKANLISRR